MDNQSEQMNLFVINNVGGIELTKKETDILMVVIIHLFPLFL